MGNPITNTSPFYYDISEYLIQSGAVDAVV